MSTTPSYGPSVAHDIRDAHIPLDDRGLVPLAEARRIVGETRVYRRGEFQEIDGTMVSESDRVWAALLSLEDAAEFVKEATRLSWEFQVRGRNNVSPFERYGAGITPWLRSRLRDDGVLVNVPWCVVPCLLVLDGREALELALATRAVHDLSQGQAALGAGPGAFAVGDEGPAPSGVRADADAVHSDASARAFLTPTKGLDLGRRWIAQNPSGYGLLAELAVNGNERASALLRDRGQALGAVVVEALEAALGTDRTEEIVRTLQLPRPAMGDGIRAVLAEAPVVDVPRGPIWSIAEMDDAAREYELQLWDNLNYTTGAMRVTGFASAEGDVLTVESIESSVLQSEPLRWRMCAYGPGACKRDASEALVDEGDLDDVWLPGDEDRVDAVTNHLCLGSDRDESGAVVQGSGERVVPAPFPFAYQGLTVRRALSSAKPEEIRTRYQLPASFGSLPADVLPKLRSLVNPLAAMIFRICAEHSGEMWADDAALRKAVGAAGDAQRLFRFTELAWPRAGEAASTSDDLVAMTEALRTRRAITRLPSTPNTSPEHWLRVRDEAGDDWAEWGGEDALARPSGEPGAGVDGYWSDMLDRGWPHGVMLMHTPDWNGAGKAEQTVAYLLDAPAQAMHLFWPRRAACMFLRAIGALEAGCGSKDPGAAKAMKKDGIVGLGEARAIVRAFAAQSFPVPQHVGADVVELLEGLVGGPQVVTIVAEALGALPAGAWKTDRPALAAAVFELGFVLRRCRGGENKARKTLAGAYRASHENDVGRALDLVLHARVGAERSARSELDYAHVGDDRTWARARIVDPATPASPIDAALYPLGGAALLDKWAQRLGDPADPRWVATQLCVLGGDEALALVLRLHALRKEARDTIQSKLLEIPTAADALRRLTGGPDGAVAKELLAALSAE